MFLQCTSKKAGIYKCALRRVKKSSLRENRKAHTERHANSRKTVIGPYFGTIVEDTA